jgi:hypothetical protein
MKQRSIAAVIILGLVTLNLYDIYWIWATRKELVARGAKIPPFWWLFLPLIAMFGIVLVQFGLRYALAAGGDSPAGTIINALSIGIGVLLLFLMIPLAYYWAYRYCQAVDWITKGKLNTGQAFALLIVTNIFSVGFVWPGIVQSHFNDLNTAAANPPAPPLPNMPNTVANAQAPTPPPVPVAAAHPQQPPHNPAEPPQNPFSV